jgi:hypothetical protein
MPNLLYNAIFQQRIKFLENNPDIALLDDMMSDDEINHILDEDDAISHNIDLQFSEAGGIPAIAYNRPQKSIVGAEWDFTDGAVAIYTQMMEAKKGRAKELSRVKVMFSRIANIHKRRQKYFEGEMDQLTGKLNGLRSLPDNRRRKQSGLQEVKHLVNHLKSTKLRDLAVERKYQRVVTGLEYLDKLYNVLWTDYWILHFPWEL